MDKHFPAELSEHENDLRKWISNFVGKTEAQAVKLLPNPTRDTWEFGRLKELALKYETKQGAKLDLYFFGGKIIKVSFVILSQ